jgi:hypothetical protein
VTGPSICPVYVNPEKTFAHTAPPLDNVMFPVPSRISALILTAGSVQLGVPRSPAAVIALLIKTFPAVAALLPPAVNSSLLLFIGPSIVMF